MAEKTIAERFSKGQVFAALFLVGALISYWRWANQNETAPELAKSSEATTGEAEAEAAPEGAWVVEIRGRRAFVGNERLDQAEFTAEVQRRRKADPRLEIVIEGRKAEPGLVDEYADLARMAGVTRVQTR